MGIPLTVEKRRTQRKRLTGLLPGMMTNHNGEQLDARPVDISQVGLGIVTNLILEKGAILTLKTHNQVIELQVSWGKKDFGKNDLYRYGLTAVDASDLEAVFGDAGCLKIV